MTAMTARNATLEELGVLLKDQHARKVDIVAPASEIKMIDGSLTIEAEPIVTEDGVTSVRGSYRPTKVCDEGLADKLGIPLPYVRRLRNERTDLLDANVNGWLSDDTRSFLLRGFRPDDGGDGVARAFLSDRYAIIDNLDALTAALNGVRASGVEVDITACDLTERRMYVRINAPSVQALAPALLERYRSPFNGRSGADNPAMSAGFVLTNSETGGGAFTIVPRLTVLVCDNGLTMTKDAVRAVHLGGKLDDGVVRWSEETVSRQLGLIQSKTADAVRSFLDVDYMLEVIARLDDQAQVELTEPIRKIQLLGKQLAFDQETVDGVLDHFVRGGDVRAGGVMQAITSYAQTVPDADKAYDLEAVAVRALSMAAAM